MDETNLQHLMVSQDTFVTIMWEIFTTVLSFIMQPFFGVYRYYRKEVFGFILDQYWTWVQNNVIWIIITAVIILGISSVVFLIAQYIFFWPINLPILIWNMALVLMFILFWAAFFYYGFLFTWWVMINIPYFIQKYWWCTIF